MEDPYRLADRMIKLVQRAERYSDEYGLPGVPFEDGVVIEALAFTAAASGARLFVDLGAGAGVSSTWIALGASRGCRGGCRLILVDMDGDVLRVARVNAEEASGGRLTVETVEADALSYIESLESVDFVMVDVSKELYPDILDALREKLRGIVVFHNALYPPPPRTFYEKLGDGWLWALIPTRLGLVVARRA